jgi:pimeloyl-ACP methyl ester carboxylesterase
MYVISCRPEFMDPPGKWVVIPSSNGLPPKNPLPSHDYLSSGFLSALVDPVVLFVHGFNNEAADVFGITAQLNGMVSDQPSLTAAGFTGTIIGFDWPTMKRDTWNLGVLFDVYRHDLQQAVAVGIPALANFLSQLSPALVGRGIRLNLMAHSMGNLIVSRVLMQQPDLAKRLDNLISFAPDILQSDAENPELEASINCLQGKWYIYWAQADILLLTASDLANMFLGNERWGGKRLGQEGPRTGADYGDKVVFRNWDEQLSKVVHNPYNPDTKEWKFTVATHAAYLVDPQFMKDVSSYLSA